MEDELTYDENIEIILTEFVHFLKIITALHRLVHRLTAGDPECAWCGEGSWVGLSIFGSETSRSEVENVKIPSIKTLSKH